MDISSLRQVDIAQVPFCTLNFSMVDASPNFAPPQKPVARASWPRIGVLGDGEALQSQANGNRHRLQRIPFPASTPATSEIARLANSSEQWVQLQKLLGWQTPRIAIKTEGRILLVSPAEVMAVEAKGNYVLLQLQAGSYLSRDSISSIADKLQGYGFIRIHRSVLINSSYAREVRPQPSGEYLIRTQDGQEYVATRTYRKNLRFLAEFWIGTTSFLAEGLETDNHGF